MQDGKRKNRILINGMAKAGTWCGTIGKISVGDFISYARLTASI